MIIGHEAETYELSKEELELATLLIPHFVKRGKDKPIKAKEIVSGVNTLYNGKSALFRLKTKFTDVRLRKIVGYYRVNSIIPILSGNIGYYVSNNADDITAMCISLKSQVSSLLCCCKGLLAIINNQPIEEDIKLNPEDLQLSKVLFLYFKNMKQEKPKKSFEIVEYVNDFHPTETKFNDVRLRKIVNHYRTNGLLPIMSNSNGYFTSYDTDMVLTMVKSLTQRATSINDASNGLEKIKNNL